MNKFPVDLHLDEDGRLALTHEEQTQRIKDFLSLGVEAREFLRLQKKTNSEIAILKRRIKNAKKASTKEKLQKLIDEIKMPEYPNYPLMTFEMAVESGIVNDIRYSPRDSVAPLKNNLASFTHYSSDDSDFFSKHEQTIKALSTFDPSNPPTEYETLLKKQNDYLNRNKIFKNRFYDNELLPNVSLSGWIKLVSRISRAVPTIIQFIENEISQIMRNPKGFMEQDSSTVRLLERITKRQIQKEQYLNIYVLAREFEKELKNEHERKIFECFFKRTKKPRDVVGNNRVRTAYRDRSVVTKRLRSYCVKMNYDEKWFRDNFGDLSAVKKLVLAEFQREYLKQSKESQEETSGLETKTYCQENNNFAVTKKIKKVTDEYYAQKDPWVLLTLLGFEKPEQTEQNAK